MTWQIFLPSNLKLSALLLTYSPNSTLQLVKGIGVGLVASLDVVLVDVIPVADSETEGFPLFLSLCRVQNFGLGGGFGFGTGWCCGGHSSSQVSDHHRCRNFESTSGGVACCTHTECGLGVDLVGTEWVASHAGGT